MARDQEVRAREQLERGMRHLAENRPAEAITNLEEASRNPALRFESASRLGRIYLGRGDVERSIEWMERALEAPAPAVEDRLALMYDLADALAKRERPLARWLSSWKSNRSPAAIETSASGSLSCRRLKLGNLDASALDGVLP